MKVIPREVRRKNVTNSKAIREMRDKLLSFTSFQEKVLIGTLLGDACLLPNVHGKNYRLQIEHGSKQKAYVWWKYKIFQDWVLSKPKFQTSVRSWKFRTISHKEFTRWHRMFYRNGRKFIPENFKKFLNNPITLAVWFMDDGGKLISYKRDRGLLLNIQQFTLKEVKFIQRVILNNFGLSSTRQWNNSGYRLYFGSKSRDQFNKLISEFIHPSLGYKLLLNPVETCGHLNNQCPL